MLILILCVAFICLAVPCASAPNFVFILTDDQDLTLHSNNYMANTTTLIANNGVTFNNFFVNTPVCCPSRSSILTGQYCHNVQVYNNSVSGGCSSPQWQETHEKNSIAALLKSSKNYKTFYAGKYLNQYGYKDTGGTEHIPPGYDWWIGLQGNSRYYNYTLSINGSGSYFENDYLTDKITAYALDFLNQESLKTENFFMTLATPACHAPFTPAPRHENVFPDLETPKELPFNVTPVNKHWLVSMPPTHLPSNVDYLDEIYRNRVRTLQAVDEMVYEVTMKLEEIGVLDNTYIIVTSDHGFHIGQFTQPWDKRQPYESDIRAPFVMRGPNIPKNQSLNYPIQAVDIAPTILDLAGVQMNNSDGVSFKTQLFNSNDTYDRYILIEYWGEGDGKTVDSECPWGPDDNLSYCIMDGWCKCQDSRNNTYSCFLQISNSANFKFCSFIDDFVESYNLITDPYELDNLYLTPEEVHQYSTVLNKLNSCESHTCKINV